MLVETTTKFLYYKMVRRELGDVFEMDDQDVPSYAFGVKPVPKKRGRRSQKGMRHEDR